LSFAPLSKKRNELISTRNDIAAQAFTIEMKFTGISNKRRGNKKYILSCPGAACSVSKP
jgi:hypothetical protein